MYDSSTTPDTDCGDGLAPVWPPTPAFSARCVDCGTMADSCRLWADLNGEPFIAYLCKSCVDRRREAR